MSKKSQSQKKNEKMPICKNCKYIGFGRATSNPNYTLSEPVCTFGLSEKRRINPISGNKLALFAEGCYDKNGKGQCQDFKEIGILRKIGRFFWFDRLV